MHLTFAPAPGNLVINARMDPMGLTLNGKLTPWPEVDEFVFYGEAGGANVTNLSPHSYTVIPSSFVRPAPEPLAPSAEELAEIAATELAEWRATAKADDWQIIAVLGAERWAKIVEWAATQNHATQTLVARATTIPRASQTVELLAWLLGLGDTEVDDLFRAAMEISA